MRARWEAERELWVSFDRLGSERVENAALGWHLDLVLALKEIDVPAIRKRALHVAVDGCASVGGVAVPALLEAMGARVSRLDCEPNGNFTRVLEPLAEHLGALGRTVVETGADFGMVGALALSAALVGFALLAHLRGGARSRRCS